MPFAQLQPARSHLPALSADADRLALTDQHDKALPTGDAGLEEVSGLGCHQCRSEWSAERGNAVRQAESVEARCWFNSNRRFRISSSVNRPERQSSPHP